MTALSNALAALAAARSLQAVNNARAEINRQAQAGTLAQDAAAALLAAASARRDEIADQGDDREDEPAPRSAAQPAPAGDRHPAVIREAAAVSYDDSGDSIRGVVAVLANGVEQLVRFRIPFSWIASIKALFTAAGLPEDADASQLAGAAVSVVLGEYTAKDGSQRAAVKRWHKPAATTRTAALDRPREVAALQHPAGKPTGPAWERDEAAATRAPRRTPAAKARAEFKQTSADDDDSMAF
jgi:hypothetical protein